MVVTKYQGQTTLTVRGPETKARPAPVPEDAEFFGITFKLGTYMPHLPVSQLVDGEITLPSGAGKSVWLKGSIWQLPAFDNADIFVAALVHEGILSRDHVVESVLQNQPLAMSARNVRRRFLYATGLTPKLIQQIERARQAAALLRKGVPILDAAFEVGYFDQPHMTKALKHLIGQTPAQILRPDDPEQLFSF